MVSSPVLLLFCVSYVIFSSVDVSSLCVQHRLRSSWRIPEATKVGATVTVPSCRASLYRGRSVLQLSENDDNLDENGGLSTEEKQAESGFDGEGFAGYLAPYAVATLGSIAITFFAFKFFFLDY